MADHDDSTAFEGSPAGKKNPNFQGDSLNTTINEAPLGRSANRTMFAPLFLVFTCSIAYIVMVYLTLPLVMNVITNRERIAKGEIDPYTSEVLASSISQFRYTYTLTGQRLATLLTGNLVGAMADVFGRKPMILVGVSGYTVTVALFLIGWYVGSWECFLVGSIALGCVTPIIPIIIAVAHDVSGDDAAAFTLHSSHVFGIQNLGLLSGMLVTVGLRVGLDNEPYFIVSFILAAVLAFIVIVVICCDYHETLPVDRRKKSMDWKLANPFGFLFVIIRNPYIFCVWAANCLYWFSVGASEAVFANWWMLRYFITDTRALPLLWFLISTWIFTGVGQFILPKLYLKLFGRKMLLHVAVCMGVAASIVVSYANDLTISYVGTSINFFASPGPPAMLALFLAQSGSGAMESGAMTGVYRSSQAGFRMIGSAAIGSYFAETIAAYTPDPSCVPKGYHPTTNPSHTCDCGVKGCPVNDTIWLPSQCAFGRLTPVPSTKAGYTAVPTKKLLSMGITERCGTPFFDDARETKVARAWCAGPDPWIGCTGLDVAALTRDGQISAMMKACWGRKNITTANKTTTTLPPSANSADTSAAPTSGAQTNSSDNATLPPSNPSETIPTPAPSSSDPVFVPSTSELSPPQWLGGARCNATTMAALKMDEPTARAAFFAGKLSYSNQSLDPVRLNRSQSIYARRGCPEEGEVEISLCRVGSLGPRVEEPSMIMFFYPILAAWLFYIVAEIFFRKYQKVEYEPPGLLQCCHKEPPVEPAQGNQSPDTRQRDGTLPSRRRSTKDLDLRRQSEAEVMLPQDPLATLKRDRAWGGDQSEVGFHPDSPERPFTIHTGGTL